MENDRSLARFAGQFVPLKIVTDNNPQWAKWTRLYPIDSNGIPRLYVIRADGEKLYADVGSLPGEKLPQMMFATLRLAGRSFTSDEAAFLKDAVSTAKSRLEREELLGASVALSSVTQVGSPADLKSYAKPAIEAAETYRQLEALLHRQFTEAESRLAESPNQSDLLEDVIAICEIEACYQLFPQWKAKGGDVTRRLSQWSQLEEAVTQARNLVKARQFALSDQARFRSRALSAYASLIRRFPDTEVESLARAELAELDPDSKVLQSDSSDGAPAMPTPVYREWTARVGEYTVRARYVQQKEGKVQLQKPDGEKILVDISALSDEDQAYLRKQ